MVHVPNDECEAAQYDRVVDGPRDVATLVEVGRNVSDHEAQVGAPQQEGRFTCVVNSVLCNVCVFAIRMTARRP